MDHSPKNPQEQERIAAAGGWVTNGRVNGVLGVSRSFGDIMYKSFSPEESPSPSHIEGDLANVWQSSFQVTSHPEVARPLPSALILSLSLKTLELVVQPTHEFLVLASDGLWEKCSCVEAVNFIRSPHPASPLFLISLPCAQETTYRARRRHESCQGNGRQSGIAGWL